MPSNDNDLCPVCGLKFSSRCRCRRGNMNCPNMHSWHVCKVHRVRVEGSGHNLGVGFDACTCPQHSTESPAGPKGTADMSGPVSFVFDLDDPVVKFH